MAKGPHLRFEGRGHDEGGRAISGAQSHRRGEKGEYVCPWREQADSQGTQPARASAGRYGRVFRGYQVLGFLYGVQHLRHSPAQGRTFVLHERARMQRKGLLPFVGLYRLEGQSCGKRQCSVFPLDGKEGENDERIWGIG